jgi:hypothetical protein
VKKSSAPKTHPRKDLRSHRISGNFHLGMGCLVHTLIGIVASMTFYMREVPPDILDLLKITGGLHDPPQMVVPGLLASGQQTNGQLAVRLDQQVGVTRTHIDGHQNSSQFHGIVGGAGGLSRTQFVVEQDGPASGPRIAGTGTIGRRQNVILYCHPNILYREYVETSS